MKNIRMLIDLPLPSFVRKQIANSCFRLARKVYGATTGAVQIHLKHDGPQVVCFLSVLTEKGRYYAKAIDWDVRRAVFSAMESIESQIRKHMSQSKDHTM